MDTYVETTVSVIKDGVCLFEADCEIRVEWELQNREDLPNWDVTEFHFTAKDRKTGLTKYTKINRTEPLFGVLYDNLNHDDITDKLREMNDDNCQI